MKNIYRKLKISSFFICLVFLSLISGLFRDILSLFLIIIIHEIGHIITSVIFNWNIKKIDITIIGGFITYDEIIDKPFIEEFLISISGFIMQIFLYIIILILHKINIIDYKNMFILNKYNIAVLLFNLIPIYPLDGSKIIYILLNMYMPYKKSLKVLNTISIISIIITLLVFYLYNVKIEYSYLIILIFIISKIIKYIKDIPYLFNKLLFERYMYPINVKKYNYIKSNNLSKFKRRKINYINKNNHYIKESVILGQMFD